MAGFQAPTRARLHGVPRAAANQGARAAGAQGVPGRGRQAHLGGHGRRRLC
jgi:hypothetical protein